MSEGDGSPREGISAYHGLDLWREVEETDVRFTKSFDRGQFKGNAVDAIWNVMRLTERLGPVGSGWGWRIKQDRLDTFGVGEDQQVIHTVVLEVWFRQADGSKEHVEHMGHTKAAYWTRPRRPGEKPRFVVDDEFGKKSVTDALSKVMVNLGASADIWMGRFDSNKWVSPSAAGDESAPDEPASHHEALLSRAREILAEVRKAVTNEAVLEAARKVKGTFNDQPFWPHLVACDRELAAEIQSLVRQKASAHGLDLSRVA